MNLYHLEVEEKSYYTTRANDNRIKVVPLSPSRGLIFDRHGEVLAENLPIYVLQMIPEKVDDLASALARLNKYIDIEADDLAKLRKSHSKKFNPVTIKTDLTDEEVARFSVHQYEFEGFSIDVRYRRNYPYGEILTHVLGYVSHINDRDIQKLREADEISNYRATKVIGKLGIEKYYEKLLHGQEGFQEVEINSRGRIIRVIKDVPPVAGKDLMLNIDINLQRFVFETLDHREGSAVVLDPKDNSILAMASSPSYDPNLFVEGISSKDYQKLLSNPFHPLVNRATLGVYPPGSTIKPFMAVAGLNENIITPTTIRDDHGTWHIPGSGRHAKVWRDWKRWGHGPVDVTMAIEESVDSFFYQMAYKLGIDRISSWMRKFGFGCPSGVDIPEESSANMPTREWKEGRYRQPWYKGDTVPVGIGQGYWTATPLQLAKATSVLVNHGSVKVPHLLKTVIDHGNPVASATLKQTVTLDKIEGVKMSTWDLALNAMRLVNSGSRGSGRRAFRNAPYCSGGKSGTAQVFSLKKDQVYKNMNVAYSLRDHALYTAYMPCEQPKYVATVVIEHGDGGAKVGAPFIRKVFDYLYVKEGAHKQDKQKTK
ncbi:Cell division protein FtsI/penicillin-binding protein 2 [Vibrio caribbeanicus ATCC BAA-2122]|uniref:Peptidoglycan D,D-transpeptidase MrdA n=1 Tax=Vibrio caribbeanicus ATCC BAA-2122 TaxID=796620 RepID=E3BGZ3_9VIBR|nr:Cell division protein FtsI/penicillin-binding protein 2 [Vibrio caribbeanicus ATCC BAA-2122]